MGSSHTSCTIAIIGRPNVGKSSLFNALIGKRVAIIDEAEGITRDRLYGDSEIFGHSITLIDTGGHLHNTEKDFQKEINAQVEIAANEADALIMVVDGSTGLTVEDEMLARHLHRLKKNIVLAVNKCDRSQTQNELHSFYTLGIPKMQTVSASQRTHLAELLMLAIETDRPKSQEEPVAKYPRIALVGKPNVGKSSLLNILLGEERSIVSPIAGTTRDSVDVTVEIDGEKYTLVDTAGIRRKQSEKEVVDKFAFIRTKEAIESADLCLLMLDANDGLHVQDKKIANLIEEYGKGCILLLNKWDLVKGFRMEHCLKTIHEENPFLAHCPALCLSAKEGRNVDKIFPVVNRVLEPTREKISTHALNKFFEQQLQKLHPPVIGGRRLRIYYATQGGMTPPTFLLFVNSPHLMQESYKRYLVREMRRTFGFEGLPVKLILKGKKKKVEDE